MSGYNKPWPKWVIITICIAVIPLWIIASVICGRDVLEEKK